MNMETFRASLRRRGKKAHVVEELVDDMRRFQGYLEKHRKHGADDATPEDLEAYAEALETAKKGSAKTGIRGIALYYDAAGNTALASLAARIREQATAKTRKAFALGEFRGVNQSDVAKLSAQGISDVRQMLEAGSTPCARRKLARQAGVPLAAILELVKLSDLSRLPGVKGIRARLYHDAGVDTLDAMAQWEPAALREMLIGFVERTGFDGIAPLPKEAESSVTRAKELPKIVRY
jgi:hypothetical protein